MNEYVYIYVHQIMRSNSQHKSQGFFFFLAQSILGIHSRKHKINDWDLPNYNTDREG